MAPRILAVCAVTSAVLAQQITSLPGLAKLPPWKMFSGYVSYTSPIQKSTHHTFHWIVESANNPATDPIVFWTNGGPGCSGLYGMGFEHGPFAAQADGQLLLNPLSWNGFATVVYIEQPAGVGFSYSSNAADYDNYNDDVAATDNAAFLSAFFAQYPQYQNNDLYLTSESYGGNYLPQWVSAVLAGGDARLQKQLKGFAVGNPVFSIDNVTTTFANIMNAVQVDIFYGHSLIPLAFIERFNAAGCAALNPPANPCDALNVEMISLAGACFAENACGDNMYNNPYGNATLGVATVPTNDVDAAWGAWLNRADVQTAIHAKTPRAPWGDCSDIGYDVTWPSSLPNYADAFRAKLRVLIFSGDVDVSTCPFSSTQVAVDALTKSGPAPITSNWTDWSILGQTAGYLERHTLFDFATIKAAGHESPGFQPLAAYSLISSFVANKLDSLTAPAPKPAAAAAAADAAPAKLTQSSILKSHMAKTLARQRAAAASAEL